VDQLLVGARLAETLFRNDVRCDVEDRLDRNLQRVLDEALLQQVRAQGTWIAQAPQLPDAALDAEQLLQHQLPVGTIHGGVAFGPLRICRRWGSRSQNSWRVRTS